MNNLTNWEDSIKGIIVKNSYSMTSIGTTDGRCEVNFDLVCGELILEIRSLLEQAKLEGRREEREQSVKNLKWLSRRLGGHSDGEVVSLDYVDARIEDLLTSLDQLGDKDLTK